MSGIRILVENTALYHETTVKGTQLVKQQVKMIGDGAPPVYFNVDARDGKAYPPGEYELSIRSFRPSRFGGLEIDPYRVDLVPLVAVAAKAVRSA